MMEQTFLSPLSRWENFYVIVGSSAGALTGLQFVVITLIAESRNTGMREVQAFGSPTVVHFCVTLLVAAIVSSPWRSLTSAAISLAACGIGGTVYAINTVRRARMQTGYKPDRADWAWYAGVPVAAYGALSISSILLVTHPASALFGVAACSLALLFLGIRNAWDTVTYVAVTRAKSEGPEGGAS